MKRLKHTRVSTGTLHEDFQYEYNLDDEITKITSLASAPLTPLSKMATAADAANRIAQFGAASYSFNQEGQTTAKTDISGTTGYQWDARGRLTRATLPSGQIVDYGYDVLGRRVNRAANGLTTTFQYDGADVVIDRIGGVGTDYLNGLEVDEKLRQSDGTWGTNYFLRDHLGSTIGLTATSGEMVELLQSYEAFGSGNISQRTRYGYTGRERDDLTGLMHYRARWYDPYQGRFFSEDQVHQESSLNLYGYVGNNPIGNIDPSGEVVQIFIGAGTSVITGFLIAKLTGQCYGWKEALIDAGTGALGVGLASKAQKLWRIQKLRQIAKSRGLSNKPGHGYTETWESGIERLHIKHEAAKNSGLQPDSYRPRFDYRTGPGQYWDPFTGRIGPGPKSALGHVPLEPPLSPSASAGVGMITGPLGTAARAGCGSNSSNCKVDVTVVE